jgi:hypothetical protein
VLINNSLRKNADVKKLPRLSASPGKKGRRRLTAALET